MFCFRHIAELLPRSCRRTRHAARVLPAILVAALACSETEPGPVDPPSEAVAAAAKLTFRQVSAGRFHSCGTTTTNRAYCWGYDVSGQLGDGTTTTHLGPVAVAGTLPFRQVSTGALHSCGVTTANLAYCWGDNTFGQLGDGTMARRLTPVAVAGGRHFRQVQAGYDHTCGVTTDNRAYCWGYNYYGQVGDGSTTDRTRPVAVAGGLGFREAIAGKIHSCGVTTTDLVYCWGSNQSGQLGDSSTAARRLKPVRVAGTRRWRQVDLGSSHTCAVTTSDRAYCWGQGVFGQIGDGLTYARFWPRAVAGGVFFQAVSAGDLHSCGVTTANRAYCWGDNTSGQLGDGTKIRRLKPVAVAGGLAMNLASAGDIHTCGKTTGRSGILLGKERRRHGRRWDDERSIDAGRRGRPYVAVSATASDQVPDLGRSGNPEPDWQRDHQAGPMPVFTEHLAAGPTTGEGGPPPTQRERHIQTQARFSTHVAQRPRSQPDRADYGSADQRCLVDASLLNGYRRD